MMIQRLLTIKHWQLFLLTYGLPIVLQFAIVVEMILTFATDRPIFGGVAIFFFMLVPLMSIVFAATMFGWMWAVVMGLNHLIPEETKPNLKRFRFFYFCGAGYVVFFALLVTSMMGSAIYQHVMPGIVWLVVVFPLHFFAMFCIFYCFYLVARTIKVAEQQRALSFTEFAEEFFLIWFFPIGVWLIQPRINKLADGDASVALSQQK